MLYHFLADLVIVAHFSFVLFVLFGGLPALRWKRLAWVHIPAFMWAGVVELTGWVCPLTHLENLLYGMAGTAMYKGGFVEHYLVPILYPEALSRELQVLFGTFVLVLNLVVYGYSMWRARFLQAAGRP